MTPSQIIDAMFNKDAFSQWLGIERVEEGKGFVILKMEIRKEMLNGFGIAHGAITYALADSALAFAANTHGQQAVSIETSISHTLPLKEGDSILAITKEENKTSKIAIYSISITNQNNEKVALFKGTVYRTRKTWKV